jgi:cytochrome P450
MPLLTLNIIACFRARIVPGKGIHYCIGASLARLQTHVAVNRLLARVPNLRLRNAAPPIWIPSMLIYGLYSLEIAWDVPGPQ